LVRCGSSKANQNQTYVEVRQNFFECPSARWLVARSTGGGRPRASGRRAPRSTTDNREVHGLMRLAAAPAPGAAAGAAAPAAAPAGGAASAPAAVTRTIPATAAAPA
jgi:hypothetical protein